MRPKGGIDGSHRSKSAYSPFKPRIFLLPLFTSSRRYNGNIKGNPSSLPKFTTNSAHYGASLRTEVRQDRQYCCSAHQSCCKSCGEIGLYASFWHDSAAYPVVIADSSAVGSKILWPNGVSRNILMRLKVACYYKEGCMHVKLLPPLNNEIAGVGGVRVG